MKRSELIFNLVSIPVDATALLLAGMAAFYIRQHFQVFVGPVQNQLPLYQFILLSLRVLPFLLVLFALTGLYNLRGTRKFMLEFTRIFTAVSLGLLLGLIAFFFRQSAFPSRFIVLAAWGLGIIFVVLGRALLKAVQKQRFARGYGLHRLVIINSSGSEAKVISQVLADRSYGYEVVAELAYSDHIIAQLEHLVAEQKVEEIMQANPHVPDEGNLQLVEFARNRGLPFSFVPNLFEVQRNVIELTNFQGVPVISLKNTPLDGWGRVAKRVFDIAASLACLVITAPIFLALAIAIRADSRGKIIYSALRGGRDRDFRFYKFRSMYSHMSVGQEYGGENAEQMRKQLWKDNMRGGEAGPFLKIRQDPRVTQVGRLMRRYKVDELPQFWNVLKGDMSMVGPRAHVLDEVERYHSRYARMFSIKPGIFGISQLAQLSWPNLPFEEEIRLNTYYIENWTLIWDLKILVKTFFSLLFGEKPKDDF